MTDDSVDLYTLLSVANSPLATPFQSKHSEKFKRSHEQDLKNAAR